MDESELESIWMTDILPIVGERMIPASHPITVFLGGQPAAGKTRAQRRLTGIYDGLLAPIIGDDFRRYHPDYERLLSEAPLDMPDATAKAAGYWTAGSRLRGRKAGFLYHRGHMAQRRDRA